LRDKHLLLGDEETESDNQSNSDDGPSETVARKYEDESNKEVINRIIKNCAKEKSEKSSMADRERNFGLSFCLRLGIGKSKRDIWDIRKTRLKLEYIFFRLSKEDS